MSKDGRKLALKKGFLFNDMLVLLQQNKMNFRKPHKKVIHLRVAWVASVPGLANSFQILTPEGLLKVHSKIGCCINELKLKFILIL